ncbi:hypothetical protein JCM3774_004020 [Rhodotorula dairenensis]
MASDGGPLFDPDITALLTAREPAWLDRLKLLDENREKLLSAATESDYDSDPDTITVPADANLTWVNNPTTAAPDHVQEDRNTRMQNDTAAQRNWDSDGVPDEEDEVMDDSIVVDPNPTPPRPVGTDFSPAGRAATARRRALEMERIPLTSSSPAKQSEGVVELSSTGSEIDDSDDAKGVRPIATRQQAEGVRTAGKAPAKITAQNARPTRPVPTRTSKGAPTATKGKGRAKARLSLEQAVDNVLKLKAGKLTDPFPTVTDLVEHLAHFKSVQPNAKRSLDGCRIVFVNTDHWRPATSTSASVPRNPIDEGLRLCLTVAAKQGATLVPPENFVAADPALSHDQLDPNRAEAEGWTTHIVPYVLTGQRLPSYDQILACLGPDEGGISREQLGPFVKVVKYQWVAACVGKSTKVQETMYLLGGDYREAARKAALPPLTAQQQRDVKERAQRVRDKAKQDAHAFEEKKKLRARAGKGAVSDSQSEKGSSSDEDEIAAVSPFGSQDWPLGEKPPPGYFDRPTTPSVGTSVSFEAVPRQGSRPGEQVGGGLAPPQGGGREPEGSAAAGRPQYKSVPGLEQEVQFLNTYGHERVDDVLAETPQTKALFELDELCILSENFDDRATDEGTDDSADDDAGPARKKLKIWKDKVSGKKPSIWACDDPAGCVARRDGPNENIAVVLEMMADLASSTTDKETFRQRSYKKAAGLVRKMLPIPQKVRHKDLIQVAGIGAKTASKIIEIARTGTHRRMQCLTDKERIARVLSRVYGIGLAHAEQYYKQGARSVDDLRQDPRKFGLTGSVLKGLEHYEDLCERIPRAEVTELYESIKHLSKKIDPQVQIECMGSYRRGAKDSGDVDLLVTRETTSPASKTHYGHIAKLWRAMDRAGIAVATLSEPEEWQGLDAKINGLCRLPHRAGAKVRRIDILGVPWHEMPAALLYFTGDDHFNRSIRLKARTHGYRLNQRGLYQNVARGRVGEKLTEGTLVPGIRTERDLFKKLCVPWREPTQRNL